MGCTTPFRSRELLEELTHHLCFATAVYGWMLHAKSGRSRLKKTPSRQVLNHGYSRELNIRAALTTMRDWGGHERSVMVFLSNANQVGLPVYAIFVDAARRQLVVALRGTLSASDVVTDVLATPLALDDPGIVPAGSGPHYVHSGFWNSAERVKADLLARGILASLLEGGGPGKDALQVDVPDCSGYGIVVVGHSLGAGVAQLLGALLRPLFPGAQLRSFGYGAPQVCSQRLAERIGEWNVSVTLGDDVISRLSIRNAEILRDRMLGLVTHCRVPKYQLLRRGLLGGSNNHIDLRSILAEEPINKAASEVLVRNAGKSASPRFWHAGPVCFLRVVRTKHSRCLGWPTDVGFRAEWAGTEDLSEILVTPRMILQHMPEQYRDAFAAALADWNQAEAWPGAEAPGT